MGTQLFDDVSDTDGLSNFADPPGIGLAASDSSDDMIGALKGSMGI